MTSLTDSTENAAVPESLVGDEKGLWVVATRDSRYHFDLNRMLVTRIRGPHAAPTMNDTTRPIAQIVHCTVGEGGYWTMRAEGLEALLLEHFWQVTSMIVSITQVDDFDPSP